MKPSGQGKSMTVKSKSRGAASTCMTKEGGKGSVGTAQHKKHTKVGPVKV